MYFLSKLPGVKMLTNMCKGLVENINQMCVSGDLNVSKLRTMTFRVLHVQPRHMVLQRPDTSRMG